MSVKQENTLLRILRNHSLRGSGEIRDLINYKLHGTNLLFGTICCIGNNHFFQGYTSMLECAAVIVDKLDRKSTRLNSSHVKISYAVFCLKKKKSSTRS